MRAKDWSSTPLGPPETWTRSVGTAVSLCLNSRFPVLLWLGAELRIVYNDAYIPFLGATKHPTMLGAPGREAWGEIWPAIGPMHDEVRAGRATWVEDLQFFFARRLPLEEVYVTFSYSPILAEDGRTVEGTFCICTETTERVLGERRLSTLRDLGLRVSEQHAVDAACRKAAEVLDANPLDIPFAAIYLLDEDGRSARLCAGTRLPARSPAFPEVQPVAGGSTPWPMAEVARTGRPVDVRGLPSRIGGLGAPLWPDAVQTAIMLPLMDASHPTLAGFLVAGIGPRRVLDADYRSFLDLVAGNIAAGIANARAFESEHRRAEALLELDRAKTNFFSNVSHEFRTPLTLMTGPLDELLAKPDSELPSDARILADVAHRNSLRLLRLVNTLLDFSRIEAGRVQASYEPVDLARFTGELASNFQSACAHASLRLDIICEPLPEPVYVDRDMWEKIVLNLVSNAFKFTLEGSIKVLVGAAAHGAELRVEDTGVGIPAQELSWVFKRFHRIEGQRSRSHEGSGIGLALVQELVRQHGGTISVESEVGRGTAFTVGLPFGTSHLPTERVGAEIAWTRTSTQPGAFLEEVLQWLPNSGVANALPTHGVAATSLPPTSHERILFADDNANMRNYLVRLLAEHWEVEAVGDGQAALEAARRRKPDLVISDMMMPGLDGKGLVSALRREPELADVPIILLSARAGEEERVEGLAAGADDYVVKPFSARELLARVASALALSKLRRDEFAAMSRLHELSARLTATADLSSLLHEVLDATMELQGAEFGNIQLYDKTTRTLGLVAQRGFGSEILDFFQNVAADEGSACARALQRRERIVIEDVTLDPEYEPHRPIAAAAGYRAVQSTPLVERSTGEPVGMLSTHFRTPHRPSTRDLRLTDLYARQAADVIASRLWTQRLRESGAKLQAAVDLVGLSPYAWDLQSGVLEWDARLKAMWGLPPDAHVDAQVFHAGIHPGDRPRVEAAIAACTDPEGDGLYEAEYRVIGIGDGIERWISTHGRTVFEEGRAAGLVGAALDITERRRAEKELAEREHHFRQLANVAQAFIWNADADGNVLFFNDRWYDYTGQTPEQALSNGWIDAVHPDDLAHMLANWQEASRLGVLCENELRYRRLDGAFRWYMTRIEPVYDETGRVTAWFGTAVDIHDRRIAEEALRESEERFRQFAEHSGDVLWIFDVETSRIEYLSPAVELVWGIPRDAMVGPLDLWAATVHAEDRERALDVMARVKLGEIVAAEYRIVRPNGAVRWIRDTFFPIRDARGAVRRAAGIAEDITQPSDMRVYLVVGGEASRKALSLVLQRMGYVVKAFASVREFLGMVPALRPGCVVVGLEATDGGGLAIPQELGARRIRLPVIVIGDSRSDRRLGVRAMKAGAVDFLDEPCEPEALLTAIATALAGIRHNDEREREGALAQARVAGMSERERSVLEGLLAGGTNKTIARDLGISPRTVEAHRARVMERLGARTLPEAVLMGTAAGLRPSSRRD